MAVIFLFVLAVFALFLHFFSINAYALYSFKAMLINGTIYLS